ncbi:MAG: hypothetical protein K2N22_05505, partial [Clostridia bacterium]|nr:hypothetical protein [Clostridia bacterium]
LYLGFIIKILLVFFILFTLFLILCIISVACSFWSKGENLDVIIMFSVVDFLLLSAILFLAFYKGNNYVFNSEKIKVYKRQRFIEEISVNEIESIRYKPFRFRYIITIFFGELIDGGAWKLHIKLKDGNSRELGCFSKKDAKQLKELYGEMFVIC